MQDVAFLELFLVWACLESCLMLASYHPEDTVLAYPALRSSCAP